MLDNAALKDLLGKNGDARCRASARAIWSTTSGCSASIGRKSSQCAGVVAASGPWAPGRRCCSRCCPMTNDRWSLDFVADQLTDGRRFRVPTVIDDCTRECLALVADTSLSGMRVASELPTVSGSTGTTSLQASRSRTPSSRASMVGCGTNCSTRPCSPRCGM
jgi:hypothetical protein